MTHPMNAPIDTKSIVFIMERDLQKRDNYKIVEESTDKIVSWHSKGDKMVHFIPWGKNSADDMKKKVTEWIDHELTMNKNKEFYLINGHTLGIKKIYKCKILTNNKGE